MRKLLGLSVVLVASLSWAAPPAKTDEASEQAKSHFALAQKLYNLSKYGEALKEFEAAYMAKSDQAFLFNVAQCQRQLGDYEAAEKSYRAYLREARDASQAQREGVQKLLADMEKAVRERRSHAPPTGLASPEGPPEEPHPSPVVVAQVEKPAPVATVSDERPIYKRWWLWTAIGGAVVVAAVVVAVVLATASGGYPSTSAADGHFQF